MSDLPQDLKYTKDHEWVRDNGDGSVTVGITDHAQEALGDLVFVELPEVGLALEAGSEDVIAVVESVKAASDIYSPMSGEVTEANEELDGAPEIINTDPYGDGWIFKARLTSSMDDLMDAAAYAELLAAEDH